MVYDPQTYVYICSHFGFVNTINHSHTNVYIFVTVTISSLFVFAVLSKTSSHPAGLFSCSPDRQRPRGQWTRRQRRIQPGGTRRSPWLTWGGQTRTSALELLFSQFDESLKENVYFYTEYTSVLRNTEWFLCLLRIHFYRTNMCNRALFKPELYLRILIFPHTWWTSSVRWVQGFFMFLFQSNSTLEQNNLFKIRLFNLNFTFSLNFWLCSILFYCAIIENRW